MIFLYVIIYNKYYLFNQNVILIINQGKIMAKIILFRGKVGVGKTTISNKISKSINLPVVRKDDVYDACINYLNIHNERNLLCTDVMRNIIETNIIKGVDVIVDDSCHYIEQISEFTQWTKKRGFELISFLCICSDEVIWSERFNKRSINQKPNQMITNFSELKQHYKDLNTECVESEHILDSSNKL